MQEYLPFSRPNRFADSGAEGGCLKALRAGY